MIHMCIGCLEQGLSAYTSIYPPCRACVPCMIVHELNMLARVFECIECISFGFKVKRLETWILNRWVLEKPYFGFYRSIWIFLVSVRQRRVPPVRAREYDYYVYCWALALLKMILIIIWTRRLGFGIVLGWFVQRTNRSTDFGKSVDRQLVGWYSW